MVCSWRVSKQTSRETSQMLDTSIGDGLLEHAWRYSFGVIGQLMMVEYVRLSSLGKENNTIKWTRQFRIILEITHIILPVSGVRTHYCCLTSCSQVSGVSSSHDGSSLIPRIFQDCPSCVGALALTQN